MQTKKLSMDKWICCIFLLYLTVASEDHNQKMTKKEVFPTVGISHLYLSIIKYLDVLDLAIQTAFVLPLHNQELAEQLYYIENQGDLTAYKRLCALKIPSISIAIFFDWRFNRQSHTMTEYFPFMFQSSITLDYFNARIAETSIYRIIKFVQMIRLDQKRLWKSVYYPAYKPRIEIVKELGEIGEIMLVLDLPLCMILTFHNQYPREIIPIYEMKIVGVHHDGFPFSAQIMLMFKVDNDLVFLSAINQFQWNLFSARSSYPPKKVNRLINYPEKEVNLSINYPEKENGIWKFHCTHHGTNNPENRNIKFFKIGNIKCLYIKFFENSKNIKRLENEFF
jgi:hypothetical protein